MHRILQFLGLLGVVVTLSACNNDVFVPRPTDQPEIEDPEPGPQTCDSLKVINFEYTDGLKEAEKEMEYTAQTTFKNMGDKVIGANILFDNYNNSVVRIASNTYWVLPCVKDSQYMINIPGLKDGVPGFYGEKLPFEIGSSVIPYQFMPGHIERYELPAYSQVTAIVTYKRKRVMASGTVYYVITPSVMSSYQTANVLVTVDVPVEINVEWGEIKPAE